MTDVDRLASIAAQLAARVRDEDPESNQRWIEAVTSERDRWDLLFILAAAIPDDIEWSTLTAWTDPVGLAPCGTTAAAARHRRRKEVLCQDCREAERARNKADYEQRRAAA